MNYVCIEEGRVCSVLNYKPNVPKSTIIREITDSDYVTLTTGQGMYDVKAGVVVKDSPKTVENKETSDSARTFLTSTDWKVLRHIREKQLKIPTSLSDQEYNNLEKERQARANLIKQ